MPSYQYESLSIVSDRKAATVTDSLMRKTSLQTSYGTDEYKIDMPGSERNSSSTKSLSAFFSACYDNPCKVLPVGLGLGMVIFGGLVVGLDDHSAAVTWGIIAMLVTATPCVAKIAIDNCCKLIQR